MTTKMRTYTELIQIPDYEGRLNYLRLHGEVGKETFGYDRYLNQILYRYPEWKKVRRDVILRDKACDLGLSDREIHLCSPYESNYKRRHFRTLGIRIESRVFNYCEFRHSPDHSLRLF